MPHPSHWYSLESSQRAQSNGPHFTLSMPHPSHRRALDEPSLISSSHTPHIGTHWIALNKPSPMMHLPSIHPLPLHVELSKKQFEEASILQGREMATEQYRQKDLHQKKDGVKTRTHVALAGRQKLNEMTKKFIKTE